MGLFFRKKPLINSEEYEKINKKVVEIEAELERLKASFAVYKKKINRKMWEEIEDSDKKQEDLYGGALGYL